MRPIKLTMSAFGPYAQEQVIDFRDLGERRFFLIHGPTGGGKTTILDAICYALYGDTSGNERSGEQMRSQMALAETPTSVTLDFSIGDRRYRVSRQPSQKRPKKRGDGTTNVIASAEISDRTGVAEVENGMPLATQPSKVTEKVETLLGFRSEQFRQVIMLPQDKFRELLLADSSKREDILQTLFQTGFYERVQVALKERAADLADEVKLVRNRQTVILQQATAQTLDELAIRRTERFRAFELVIEELKNLRDAEEKASRCLADDQLIQGRFDEYRKASVALKTTESKAPEFELMQRSVEAAERANQAVGEEAALATQKRDAQQRQDKLKAAKSAEDQLRKRRATTSALLAKAIARKDERDSSSADVGRVEGLREKVQGIEGASKKAKQAAQQLSDAKGELSRSRTASTDSIAKATEVNQEFNRISTIAAGLEGHRLSAKNARRVLEERTKLRDFDGSAARMSITIVAAAKKRDAADLALTKTKAACADVQRAWIDGQAARLAKELKDGKPCPVCGALEHPIPARSTHVVPSDEDLKAVQSAVDDQAAVVAKATDAVLTLNNELEKTKAKADTYRVALGVAAEETVDSLHESLVAMEAVREQAEAAVKRLPNLEGLVKATQENVAKTGLRLTEVEELHRITEETNSTAKAILAGYEQGVPEKLRSLTALEAELTRLRGVITEIDRQTQEAKNADDEVDRKLAAAIESVTTAHREASESTIALDSANRTFNQKIVDCGFASIADFTMAKLSNDEIAIRRKAVEDYNGGLRAARDRVGRAHEAIEGHTEPDMAASKSNAAGAKRTLELAIGKSNDLKRDVERIDEWLRDLRAAGEDLGKLDTRYAVIGRLAEVADGRNKSGLKFSRFVLGFLLDDVLGAATEWLTIMSKGRYQLRRCMERTDNRTSGGLDLEIFDGHTGYSRPAATLSGGESFLASLSLALGLADVVQARAGGIRMETMFIDEGFGSLDTETLDLAVRSLIDLFKDGRLVGIISHVPELRERIDARLEVRQTLRGSSVSFALK